MVIPIFRWNYQSLF